MNMSRYCVQHGKLDAYIGTLVQFGQAYTWCKKSKHVLRIQFIVQYLKWSFVYMTLHHDVHVDVSKLWHRQRVHPKRQLVAYCYLFVSQKPTCYQICLRSMSALLPLHADSLVYAVRAIPFWSSMVFFLMPSATVRYFCSMASCHSYKIKINARQKSIISSAIRKLQFFKWTNIWITQ